MILSAITFKRNRRAPTCDLQVTYKLQKTYRENINTSYTLRNQFILMKKIIFIRLQGV